MIWLAVYNDGTEVICNVQPYRDYIDNIWSIECTFDSCAITLPKGSIKKFIGKNLTWEDEPVELKINNYN